MIVWYCPQRLERVPPIRRESLNLVTSDDLIIEYLTRTDRLPLEHIFSRLPLAPLPTPVKPDFKLAYERPQNLALELSKSILYESIDLKTLNSQENSEHCNTDDSLWNGKPQQYFESLNARGEDQCVDTNESMNNWKTFIILFTSMYMDRPIPYECVLRNINKICC